MFTLTPRQLRRLSLSLSLRTKPKKLLCAESVLSSPRALSVSLLLLLLLRVLFFGEFNFKSVSFFLRQSLSVNSFEIVWWCCFVAKSVFAFFRHAMSRSTRLLPESVLSSRQHSLFSFSFFFFFFFVSCFSGSSTSSRFLFCSVRQSLSRGFF